MTPWPDRLIAEIANKQLTLVTHEQLVALSVGRGAISRALGRGRLHHCHQAVYSVAPPEARPPLTAELAAVLACGASAYVSHDSAAAVWELRPPPPAGAVHVTVLSRQAGRRRAGIHVHRTSRLNPVDIRNYKTLPITSPSRTLLDIAADLPDRDLERAFDEALLRKLTTRAAVKATLAAYPRTTGAARLNELAHPARHTTMTRSEGEERMLALIRAGGLPQAEMNVRVGRWQVDFLWRRERLIVELDGFAYHSTPAALERDHRKDAELQALGFCVIRISGRRLRYAPEEVLVQIVTALVRRQTAA